MSSESLEEHSPQAETSPSPQGNGASAPYNNNKPILLGLGGVAVVAILGFLCLLCILSILLVRNFWPDTPTAEATPIPTLTPLAVVATSEPQVIGVSNSGTISVTLGTPVLLR